MQRVTTCACRFFDGRKLIVEYYDGKTNYAVAGVYNVMCTRVIADGLQRMRLHALQETNRSQSG
jgi:hypothetical protein